MKKINVYIDYPVSRDQTFKGLSFPQMLFDFLYTEKDIRLVTESDDIDVLLVINGGSHHRPFNERMKERITQKKYFSISKKINFDRFLSRNSAYEKRIQKLINKNPNMKIIHRLDDRYRMLCKVYGYDATIRWINERSHLTIFQSNYCKSLYVRDIDTIFGREKKFNIKKNEVIYNGVDRTIFTNIGTQIDLPGKIKIFHVAATGMVRKGLGLVLEIAHILEKNEDIQFYLVGRQADDPIYGSDIASFNNVHQLPFTSDRYQLAEYYRSGDILLFPSMNDCSPNVVTEAMSCGMPVIGLDSGGTPEIIVKADIKGGLLLDPKNPIYAVKEVIHNLEKFKENAIKLVDTYHSSKVIGTKYANCIRQLVN